MAKKVFVDCMGKCMGNVNDNPLWVIRKNKQRGKTFKYVYIRSTKVLLKYMPLAVNSL